MATELTIRPTHNDHLLIADLLAPGHGGRPEGAAPLIGRLVIDAPLSIETTAYADAARSAGVPTVVDPLTWLGQGPVDADTTWGRLSYASRRPTLDQLQEPRRRKAYIEQVVSFQLDHAATVIVPPYFAAKTPTDGWQFATIRCLVETSEWLRGQGIQIPLLPVISGSLDRFARDGGRASLREFGSRAQEVGAQHIAAQFGPVGSSSDNYAKVLQLFTVIERLRRPGLGVHVWRQGAYGPALVAAGAFGYETGIGYGEKTDLAGRSRKVKPATQAAVGADTKSGGGGRPVFIRQFGRSVDPRVVRALATDNAFRGHLLCDPRCCPDGPEGTLQQHRQHTVRARAQQLADIDAIPAQARWRLHMVAVDAAKAATLITTAAPLLERHNLKPLNPTSQQSLAAVTSFLQGRTAVA